MSLRLPTEASLAEFLKDRHVTVRIHQYPDYPSPEPDLGPARPIKQAIKRRRRVAKPQTRRVLVATEAEVLKAVLAFLKLHPKVAWAIRLNSGATKIDNRFVRFGTPGLPDVIGQMRDGRMLAIECKSTIGSPTPDQNAFLSKVSMHNGVAGVARSVEDVLRIVGEGA